jgi:secreted Zn-dependent insulinase-like peptidase
MTYLPPFLIAGTVSGAVGKIIYDKVLDDRKNKEILHNIDNFIKHLKKNIKEGLNRNYEEISQEIVVTTIEILKNINITPENKKITAEIKTIKYYFGHSDSLLLNDITIKNMLNGTIGYISKEDIHYEVLVNLYKEVLGDNYYE